MYSRILRKIAHVQVEHPFTVLLIVLAGTLIMLGGAQNLITTASLEQMMPQDAPEIEAFNHLRDTGMGQDQIVISLELDQSPSQAYFTSITDPEILAFQGRIYQTLRTSSDIEHIRSIIELLPDTDPTTQQLLLAGPLKEQSSMFINPQATRSILIVQTSVGADDQRISRLAQHIETELETLNAPPGVIVEITGTPVVQQRLSTLITQDRNNTQWISTILVFLITAIMFFSFSSAIVPIIVVTISVNWLYGTMGYTGLPISTLAGGVAAMVIGIGIDFAIHIINKFHYERKQGMNIKQSIEAAVVDTGTALTATSITTIAAFLAFLLGTMPEMNRFGLLMAMGIGYSLTFTLFGLPALLVLEEKILYFVRDKMRFGIDKEFKLAGGDKRA